MGLEFNREVRNRDKILGFFDTQMVFKVKGYGEIDFLGKKIELVKR